MGALLACVFLVDELDWTGENSIFFLRFNYTFGILGANLLWVRSRLKSEAGVLFALACLSAVKKSKSKFSEKPGNPGLSL